MSQDIQLISIEDLVLWTENPRDPIDPHAKDQDIVDLALSESRKARWKLSELANSMKPRYDFSELPTVVMKEGKPVVFDGNRRMIIAKIKLGCATGNIKGLETLDIPEKIPCNVCEERIALENVLRKHGSSGSWLPLERDKFIDNYRLENEPSYFLQFERATGLISKFPELNQGFVKEEIFTPARLQLLGLKIQSGELLSRSTNEDTDKILTNIRDKITSKQISTRNKRGSVLEVLDQEVKEIVARDQSKSYHSITPSDFSSSQIGQTVNPRLTKKTSKSAPELFGQKLQLRFGAVNDLYRDLSHLYIYYVQHQDTLGSSFSSLIRMGLRLLVETASENTNGKPSIKEFCDKYFERAKANLSQDQKTSLSNDNVHAGTLQQLLHTGAHNYQASQNINQTISISIILAEMLKLSHGK